MEKNKKVRFEVYIIAILVASGFFIAGIAIRDFVAYDKLGEISAYQKTISALLEVSEIKGELLQIDSEDYCNLSWDDVWKEKVEIGNILGMLETKLGKQDPKVLEQKKMYNKVQLSTLNLVKNINENCDYDWDIIVFFYTNNKTSELGDYELGSLQGSVLDTIYQADKENIRIFSIDAELLDQEIRDSFFEEYGLNSTPSVIINEEGYDRFMSRNEILEIIS